MTHPMLGERLERLLAEARNSMSSAQKQDIANRVADVIIHQIDFCLDLAYMQGRNDGIRDMRAALTEATFSTPTMTTIPAPQNPAERNAGAAMSEHRWVGRQLGGSPVNAESYEWVRYCEVCGMEDTCEDPLPPCVGGLAGTTLGTTPCVHDPAARRPYCEICAAKAKAAMR